MSHSQIKHCALIDVRWLQDNKELSLTVQKGCISKANDQNQGKFLSKLAGKPYMCIQGIGEQIYLSVETKCVNVFIYNINIWDAITFNLTLEPLVDLNEFSSIFLSEAFSFLTFRKQMQTSLESL